MNLNNLPMQKSSEELKFYKRSAKKFGNCLKKITGQIYKGEIKSSQEANNCFEKEVKKRFRRSYDIFSFPFALQKNHLDEPFSKSVCISVNNCVAHGGKINYFFEKGDIVTVDAGISLSKNSRKLYFDAAITTLFCGEENNNPKIVNVPLKALKEISQLSEEIRISDISKIIQEIAASEEVNIVNALCGHGIGYSLHEAPSIPNVVSQGCFQKLIPYTVFCPEPMYIQEGAGEIADVYLSSDGWSVMGYNLSSHWETMFLYDGEKLIDIVGVLDYKDILGD